MCFVLLYIILLLLIVLHVAVITVIIPAGDTDSEVVFMYPAADPYLAEDQAFLSAVTSGNLSTVQSSYCDAASTYCLSWAIRSSSTE